MARSINDVAKYVYENTIQENEKRLREARIKGQGKGRSRQELNRLFRKLNQAAVEENSMKSSDKLNLSRYNRNVTSCWYGPIPEFPPGSWWGIRMDCSRDGVHNPFNADVHEGSFGAASVCTSQANMNEDVDLGDFLTFTGQVYRKEQPSADPFIYNYRNQIPLRLIRSYNLQNNIAPNTGYRYDGLYIVISYWISVSVDGTKYNKFVLMRLADQEAPSWNSKSCEVPSSTRHSVSSTRSSYPKPCVTSNTYDLRKCSHNTTDICGKRKFSHRDSREATLPVTKTTPSFDTRKSVPESSIVTRHVFKKPSNVENTTCSTSVPDRKTFTCLGTSAPKTHSTNISIRMGLYESSHNAQEARKSITTMLHKPFKPIDIANRTALDIDARPLPKEDAKSIVRVDADTATRVNSQPIESASCNDHIASDLDEPTCPMNKRKKNSCSRDVHPSGRSSYVTPAPSNGPENDVNVTECQEHSRDAEQVTNVSVPVSNRASQPPRSSVPTRGRIFKRPDAPEQSGESLHAQDIKSLKSLESLTPDKILNLINKEKHHPLSKMLIGNVIGLTTEECAMWDASKVVTSDTSPKISHKQRDNAKENVACLPEDLLNRRCCRYSRSKRLTWKVSKQTDASKFDKVLPRQSRNNDVDQNCNSNARMKNPGDGSNENEYLFHVQSPLQAIAQHTRSAYDIKTRLRADKGMLAKQDFPSSSMKKSRLNKKGDREIANLSIDANIGPKTRGPRNRRLRCINNTYTNKRCYSTLNTIMYPPGKRNRITEKQRYKSSFKRKSKPTKVSRQPARDRQSKDRYRVSNALRAKGSAEDVNSAKKEESFEGATKNSSASYNGGSNNETGRMKESRGATVSDVGDCNVPKSSFDRSLRKKLAQTVPLSRHASQNSRLHYFRKKQAEKPITMDATTQCRLIFEDPTENSNSSSSSNNSFQTNVASGKPEFTSSGRPADRRAKLQPESVLDVVCNDQGSQIYATTLHTATSAALTKVDESHASSSGFSLHKTPTERSSKGSSASAFVPVNTWDSDLRIARLRSIGFRPIIKPRSPFDEWIAQAERKNLLMSASKVTKRNVAEEYDKYTNNEDNNVVVYMDDELQYQDIEEEEDETARMNASIKSTFVENDDGNDDDDDHEEDIQSYDDNTVLSKTIVLRENLESPWHGWKKIVTNNRSYWIGW